jgi:hypothetical protein
MTKTIDPVAEVRKAARRNRHFYTEDAIRKAAALLADLYEVGERHGVPRGGWDLVTGLPSAALEVVNPWKDEIPQTNAAGVEQLDQVVAALRSILVDEPDRARRVERDVIRARVRVPRTDATPWARHDLAITLNRDNGWNFELYTDRSTVIGVTGPFGKDGAASVAELAVDVVAGRHGDLFTSWRP